MRDANSGVLRTALQVGKRVSFTYDHKPRVVEVHALGMDKSGDDVIRGYQVEGGSVSGSPSDWRLFKVKRIAGVPQILDNDSLAPREGYSMGDKAMSVIDAQIELAAE